MILWLLEKTVLDQLEKAQLNGVAPTVEQEREFVASMQAADGELPRIMSVVGNQAGIQVNGVLTDAPSWMARYFGGGNTTYAEIRSAVALAEADPKVSEIVLSINSPGGQASSEWVETMDAINSATKPVHAMVGNIAASAAYGIASQANSITAQNRMSQVGSVGVVSTHYVSESTVEVVSSNAPNKRPDVTTEAGKAVVRTVIDQMETVFIDAISRGRNKKRHTIITDFGQGAVVLAGEAVERGMIDSVSSESTTRTAAAKSGMQQAKESKKMDKTELKAKHADLYQAVMDEGVALERDRVGAHMTMGKASGDMATATQAIAEGTGMTATLQAKYMAAGMNKADVEDRQEESDAAAAGDTATKIDTPQTDAEEIADLVCGTEAE